MKAISIRQPWAWLIVNGYKDVENRTWSTKHRGPILIHAGKTLDPYFDEIRQDVLAQRVEFPDAKHIERGGIVGQANLVDCVTESSSEWFNGPYGFVLEDAQPRSPSSPATAGLGFSICEHSARWGH